MPPHCHSPASQPERRVRPCAAGAAPALAHSVADNSSTIEPHHLKPTSHSAQTLENLDECSLDEATRRFQAIHVSQVLDRCEGNRSRAAKMLGVSRQWLYQLLAKLELQ